MSAPTLEHAPHGRAAGQACPTCGYRKRRAPWHVLEARDAYVLARISWEENLERETRGHLGGDEERDYRLEHPAPTFRPFLEEINARQRALRDGATS